MKFLQELVGSSNTGVHNTVVLLQLLREQQLINDVINLDWLEHEFFKYEIDSVSFKENFKYVFICRV